MLKTVCVGLILIVMLGSGVLGEDCQDKLASCNAVMVDLSTSLSALAQNSSTLVVSAVNQTCLNHTVRITECTDYLTRNCNEYATQALILQQKVAATCGTDPGCLIQLLRCQAILTTRSQSQTLTGVCQKWETAKTCLNTDLDSQCLQEPAVPISKASVINNPFYSGGCQPGSNIKCPKALLCMVSVPSSSGQLTCSSGVKVIMECLAGLKGECNVTEDNVTFRKVQEAATDVCQVMEQEGSRVSNCPTMANCVQKTDLFKAVINPTTGGFDMNRVIDTLLTSQAWCRYLEQTSSCVVSSASSCNFDSSLRDTMSQKVEMMKTVCSTNGAAGMMLSKLSLWVVFLLCFTQTHIFKNNNGLNNDLVKPLIYVQHGK